MSEYKITTMDDILKIPSDRIEVMFSELIPHIKQMALLKETLVADGLVPEGVSVDEMIKLGTMTWNDDGKNDVTTNLTIKSMGEK